MALSNIGAIAVNLLARTDRFNKNIDKSRKKLTTFSKTTQAASKQMKILGAAALGAVGLGGFGVFVKNQVESLDALGKTSSKLGIATDKLQAYQHAAIRSGVSVNALNTGLQRMTRRVSEAAIGTGEAKKALAELGLDAVSLNAAGTEKAFRKIGSAIMRLDNQSDRVRIASKIFDTEGVGLVNTFAENLDALEKKFANPSLKDGVARVEELSNSITDLKSAFAIQGQKLVISVAPTAIRLMKVLQDYVDSLELRLKLLSRFAKESGVFVTGGVTSSGQRLRPDIAAKANKNSSISAFLDAFGDASSSGTLKSLNQSGRNTPAPAGVIASQQRRGVFFPQESQSDLRTIAESTEAMAINLGRAAPRPATTLQPSIIEP